MLGTRNRNPVRVGFFGDVHGDLQALEWALQTLSDVEQVICTGDVVDGPRDADCIRLLRERQIPVLRGNHDDWAGLDLRMGNPRSQEEREWLLGLPLEQAGQGWLAYHSRYEFDGDQRVHWEYLLDERSVWRALHERSEQLLFCGHTHVPAVSVLTDGKLEFWSTTRLQSSPVLAIEPGKRYLINVGQPRLCAVKLDTELARLEYRFASTPAPPRPPRRPGWWTRVLRRMLPARQPKRGEWPAF